MFYSEKFKKQVRRVYSDNEEILVLLDSGSHLLGMYLEAEVKEGIDFDAVLSVNSLEELEKLKKVAEIQKKKKEVFQEWKKLDNLNRYRAMYS